MAWTAEQKRDAHAQRKHDRAAEDERRSVRRRPRGRPPLYQRWDESVGAWVLDEAGEALERRQLELPPLASCPRDLNTWAVANPPPRRDDFATQELFDEAREPWYEMLMGKRLPHTERARAWGMACIRHSERSLSHDIAQERAVIKAERDAAALAVMEKAVQAEREQKLKEDVAVAALKERLADCERRELVRYHDACGTTQKCRVRRRTAGRCARCPKTSSSARRAPSMSRASVRFKVNASQKSALRCGEGAMGPSSQSPAGIGRTLWVAVPGVRASEIRDQSDPWHDAHHDAYCGHVKGSSVLIDRV
tara:strand:- start:92 stop:1015 length:924 start_codon:yes stop_codon:yes gene_type:complete